MRIKKFTLILVIFCMLFVLTGCGKDCVLECGSKADSKCAADMCDDCCDYFQGLNGCFKDH